MQNGKLRPFITLQNRDSAAFLTLRKSASSALEDRGDATMSDISTQGAQARRATTNWGLLILLGLPALAALWFVSQKLNYIIDFSEASYTPYFWPRGTGLWIHVSTGLVALAVGIVQIWLGLTGQTSKLHRTLGKLYVAVIAISSIAGAYMALTIPEGVVYQTGLLMLSIVWFTCTAMAVFAIRKRNIRQHKEWMLRSYTVTFAFVVFRLVSDVVVAQTGISADDIGTIMAWACWAVPLLVLEVGMQLRAMTRSKARA
jgi:uncharacterized membrane protein